MPEATTARPGGGRCPLFLVNKLRFCKGHVTRSRSQSQKSGNLGFWSPKGILPAVTFKSLVLPQSFRASCGPRGAQRPAASTFPIWKVGAGTEVPKDAASRLRCTCGATGTKDGQSGVARRKGHRCSLSSGWPLTGQSPGLGTAWGTEPGQERDYKQRADGGCPQEAESESSGGGGRTCPVLCRVHGRVCLGQWAGKPLSCLLADTAQLQGTRAAASLQARALGHLPFDPTRPDPGGQGKGTQDPEVLESSHR